MRTRLRGIWYRVRLLAIVMIATVSASTFAHNTNTSHTRITEAAIQSIIAHDAARVNEMERSAYAELYALDASNARINWGSDPRYNEGDAVAKSTSEFKSPYSVMDGVVLEDDPVTRVFTHFYQGYSGAGGNSFLNLLFAESAPSAVVAHRYFDQAIEVYGYEDEESTATDIIVPPQGLPIEVTLRAGAAKEMGFFLFGHALHHAEDMSSIAHSQNDAHLTLGESPGGHFVNEIIDFIGSGEADDFESQFLPTLLWEANDDGPSGTNVVDRRFFGPPGGGSWLPIDVDSLDDIWSPPRAHGLPLEQGPGGNLIDPNVGLSRSVVNATIFQGDFGVPLGLGCAEFESMGELPRMFNRDATATCSIFFELDVLSQHLGWRLEISAPPHDVGWWLAFGISIEFAHRSSWWSMDSIGGPSPLAIPGGEYYYIEQLMEGVDGGAAFDEDKLLRPPGVRVDPTVPWNLTFNQVMDNPVVVDDFGATRPRSLAELFSDTLLPLATQYAAGFAQLWYDFANHPPYLEKLEVRQDNDVRYSASWLDINETRTINFYDEFLLIDSPLFFNYVTERNLVIEKIKHVDPEMEITIVLKFNEPVQDMGDDKIAIWLNDMEVMDGGYTLVPTPPTVATAWDSNREWTITIADLETALVGDIPEGEVKLTVQAYDRNFHRTASGVARTFGARLDENPGTPARRQRLNPDEPRDQQVEDRALWGVYNWHDMNSIDVNFPEMEAGDFAYDRTPLNQPVTGDSTHVLLFDIQPPEATLDVQR